MERPLDDRVDWDSLRKDGGNVVLNFLTGKPRHLVVIPEEVLEDGLGTFNEEGLSSARANASKIEAAISSATSRGEWRDMVEIYSGTELAQLWISRDDFEPQI